MSEVLPRHYIYGIVLFVFVLLGGTALMQSLAAHQPSLLDNKYGEFSNYVNSTAESLYAQTSEIEEATSSSPQEQSAFGWLNSLIGTGWTILKNIYSTFSFGGTAFMALGSIIGVPGWMVSLLLLLVTLVIAFSIMSAIFQKDV